MMVSNDDRWLIMVNNSQMLHGAGIVTFTPRMAQFCR